ncbi:MAG: hypothetical protein DI524_17460 [Ectopseudomonas oleovorans]|nr:MAG: hypothetical protein DI524_17460 [Pseudomonas oleovorans]
MLALSDCQKAAEVAAVSNTSNAERMGWRRTCAMFYAVNGEKPVGAITKADVLAFRAHLIAKGNAPATVDSRLNHLRSLFRIAVEQDVIPLDPAATVKAPSVAASKQRENFTARNLLFYRAL